ncbi:hypothetical protein [Wolbachia endosymbiont (group B) of Ischnura elegans]|uniref:hypothetical protein n=1 Tax=Wolbachia endosymbiont (group B) of Ischnura elegans TaxID=2954021 RepID=UPI0022311462|nr:hypothetical protein [Wolbachia endosymbiont (group B) of Ischnura elegans]
MSDLKLIQMQERSYIICSRRQDKLDWPNIVDPYCNNEIFIDEDFNEACDNIICENCNRDILPNTYKKQRFHRLSAYLNPEKFMHWFEGQLSDTNFMWQKVERGVYHVGRQGKIVSLIILDFCTNPTFLTIDKLKANPTVLIILRKNPSNIPLDLPIVKMVDLFFQHQTLIEVFQEAIQRGVPELIPNTSMQILHTSLNLIEPPKEKELLKLQLIEGSLYVNNIEILNKKAVACMRVFAYYLNNFCMIVKKNYLLKNTCCLA